MRKKRGEIRKIKVEEEMQTWKGSDGEYNGNSVKGIYIERKKIEKRNRVEEALKREVGRDRPFKWH